LQTTMSVMVGASHRVGPLQKKRDNWKKGERGKKKRGTATGLGKKKRFPETGKRPKAGFAHGGKKKLSSESRIKVKCKTAQRLYRREKTVKAGVKTRPWGGRIGKHGSKASRTIQPAGPKRGGGTWVTKKG